METLAFLVVMLGFFGYMLYQQYTYPKCVVLFAIGLLIAWMGDFGPWILHLFFWISLGVSCLLVRVGQYRKMFVTQPLFSFLKQSIPRISQTEEEALNAGESWFETEVFRGNPNWQRILEQKLSALTEEEQSFLNNETEQLCSLIHDWEIVHERFDLPEVIWNFLKENGFFGLVISREYGGKGFSAACHSAVVMKVASKSMTAAVTVMVPNSLGPGELLMHYGTDEQKNKYLPRLAKGQEIPCFALTGTLVGSDATSMPDIGIVCEGEFQGQRILGIRLQFSKRYISLAPIATLVVLAFKLEDPQEFLGHKKDIGITCCLLPTSHPGVKVGDRHIPLDMAFMNGTLSGQDVFIPLDWVIGGREKVGQGWRMLVECLSIGRAISLPAVSVANAMVCFMTCGAYARVREQFNLSIGHFEGIQNVLGRIGGLTYLMEATRLLTLSAVDAGKKPSVASAIAKYHLTELSRQVLNDAMDIHGGKGIMMGPKNYLGRAYQGIPIAITVEGANILTRNLIIFGQGAMFAHPYIRNIFYAVQNPDAQAGVKALDEVLLSYMAYHMHNKIRAVWYGFTGGLLIEAPGGELHRFYQSVTRLSAAYAWIADLALMILGGGLKRREYLSAKLGDVMSYLYMAMATLKAFSDHGDLAEELPYAKWALEFTLHNAEEALFDVLQEFPVPSLGRIIRFFAFPWGRSHANPKFSTASQVAEQMQMETVYRKFLQAQCAKFKTTEEGVGQLEFAFSKLLESVASSKKLKAFIKRHSDYQALEWLDQAKKALEHNEMTQMEYDLLVEAFHAQVAALQVDAFPKTEVRSRLG